MTVRMWTAILALLGLSACFPALSQVSAIPDDMPPLELALTPGLYCRVGFEIDIKHDDDGRAVERLDVSSYGPCFTIDIEGDVVRIARPEGRAISGRIARLSRGALVAEVLNDEGMFELYLVRAVDDAFALLQSPLMTSAIADAADRHGVTLVDATPAEGDPLEIAAGAPADVLAFVRDASGLWFDHALRDPALFAELRDEGAFAVRFDADPRETPPDEMRVRARIDRVRTAIRFAMTLE